MREKNIGMEHATIALTIEQTISSMICDPNSTFTSISEILDTWIKCLQHAQPKPLSVLTMKSSSAFGTPLRTLQLSKISPVTSQKPPELSPSIKISTVQHPSNPPCTPVCNMGTAGKAMSSHATRTKVGGKKSNRAPILTPPLSAITIATMPSVSSSQRARVHSGTEPVSAKTTSSTSGIDGESSQHIPIVSKGKPPLAPNTNGLSSASGSLSASIGRSGSSVASLNSNSKRTNTDPARLEDQQESSSSSSRGVRPASPSSLTLPSSNKRQRRSTSMSSGN